MEIEEEKTGSLVVVALGGRVDGHSGPDLEKRISEIIGRGDTRVLLDCEKMEYISSAGLRVVLVGAKQCQKAGGKLALCALQPTCKEVMEISGFLTMLDCYETRTDACAAESQEGEAQPC